MIFDTCNPKVSLIIPVYQVEDYLSLCLDSVLEQTLLDMEVICVDDGSTDNSGWIADRYAQIDKRIKVIHKENGGLSSARNAGLRAAKGDVVMFLDSDDCLQPWACTRMWEETLQNGAEITIFGADLFPAYYELDSWLWWTLTPGRKFFPEFVPEALFSTIGATPFVWRQAFSRELLERSQVMFDETVRYGEDVIFQLEIFPYAHAISFIPDKAYLYRFQRTDSLMANEKRDEDGRIRKHITAVEKAAEFWNKRDLTPKYGGEFFAWALNYIVSDLKRYDLKDERSVSGEFIESLKRTGLMACEPKLSSAGRRDLKTLKSKAG